MLGAEYKEETEPLRSRMDSIVFWELPASSSSRLLKSKSRAGSAISGLKAGSSMSMSWSGLYLISVALYANIMTYRAFELLASRSLLFTTRNNARIWA